MGSKTHETEEIDVESLLLSDAMENAQEISEAEFDEELMKLHVFLYDEMHEIQERLRQVEMYRYKIDYARRIGKRMVYYVNKETGSVFARSLEKDKMGFIKNGK